MSQHKFKTTNIRGKQYVEVNERIKFFRQEDQYKNWTISTEINMMKMGDECICASASLPTPTNESSLRVMPMRSSRRATSTRHRLSRTVRHPPLVVPSP